MAAVMLEIMDRGGIGKAGHENNADADEGREYDGRYAGVGFYGGLGRCVHNNLL